MIDLTRRTFLASAAAIPLSVWLKSQAEAGPTPKFVRYDARSANGQAMLKTYAKAVDTMKTTAEGDPKSWQFQWYTHWVKGSTTKAAEITRIFPTPSDWRDLAGEMWNTCQAHGPGMDENFFLPWHRAFLIYFETIIRSVSGDASFTLPYWDYSTSDTTIRGVIPPEFRKKGDPTFGSLYVDKRNQGVNAGEPIQQGEPGDPLSTDALEECLYEPQDPEMGFCMRLDATLHGNVHGLVGNGQNMGSVPWACGDPIFWLHHCNIDRLWASWNAAGPPRTNPSLSESFVFADENGKRVVANLADFMDTLKLGYTYDRLETAPSCPTPPPAIAAAAKTQTKVATVKATPIKLGADAVKVTLDPFSDQDNKTPTPFRARVESLKEGRRFFIVVRGLHADQQPGVLYHIYLELPRDATDEQRNAHHVGALNFFDAVSHGDHEHETSAKKGTEKFISFNVTKLTKMLHSKKQLADKPTVTIAPAGRPAGDSNPTIGEINVIEQ